MKIRKRSDVSRIKISQLRKLISNKQKLIKVRERQIRYTKKEVTALKKIQRKAKKKRERTAVVPKISLKRIRHSLTQVFKDDLPPYYVHIRSMTLNSTYNNRALLEAIKRGKVEASRDFNINLKQVLGEEGFTAPSHQVIPTDEDIQLNDMKIHVEIFIANWKGRKLIKKIYKYT